MKPEIFRDGCANIGQGLARAQVDAAANPRAAGQYRDVLA